MTGNPYTPIVGGTFDSDNDVYLPQRGSFYSERYKDFYQADLRFDKKWIYDEEIWSTLSRYPKRFQYKKYGIHRVFI